MNDRPIRLTDDLLARVLRARSTDAGARLLDDILGQVTGTPQDRRWLALHPALPPRRTLLLVAMVALVLAALGTIAIGTRLFFAEPVPLVRTNGEIVALRGPGRPVSFDPLTGERRQADLCDGCSLLSWSGDGSKLAYLRSGAIFLRDIASGTTTEVATCNPSCFGVSLSFDGSMVAYVYGSHAYTRAVAGGPERPLTHQGDVIDVAWSPLGDQLLLTGQETLHRVDAEGGGLELLVGGSVQHVPITSGPIYGSWSPDADRIAYVIDPPKAGPGGPFEYQLWVMRADGSDRRQIFTIPDCCVRAIVGPTWSPDGTEIAFVAGPDAYQLWVVHEDGSNPRRFGEVQAERVAWRARQEP